ncbi:hypothetical protein A3Q56_05337 [Intoshia linei]|uniref:Uncharacterized protein n=1 Tax=Intoshia linei TaxID=1819745 RepID=A0A177AY50_9BILA|nr:hypothetical protein A3Q56_05337 [Intoshia linei]
MYKKSKSAIEGTSEIWSNNLVPFHKRIKLRGLIESIYISSADFNKLPANSELLGRLFHNEEYIGKK